MHKGIGNGKKTQTKYTLVITSAPALVITENAIHLHGNTSSTSVY